MNNKLNNIAQSIANELSNEKAYEIPNLCNRYKLGDGNNYASPTSKQKFLLRLIAEKNEKFITDLAKKIVEDYNSDSIAYSLNEYYDGKYFKISIVTRQELLEALYKCNGLNGKMSISDFLSSCGLPYNPSFNVNILFESIFSLTKSSINNEEENLINILSEMRLYEKLDSKFFCFLEQIVHPYVRANIDAEPLIKLINKFIERDNYSLKAVNNISGQIIYKVLPNTGISTTVKNLIFASNSYKPEIVLEDALCNTIKIVKNEEFCLVYERPIKITGLLWIELVNWWSQTQGAQPSKKQALSLKSRLADSLASPPERVLFDTYYKEFSSILKQNLPALIPQVYLHYNPYSIKRFGFQYLLRQRMDFLLLLKNNVRVVIEIDGKQHYSEGDISSPRLYAEMVKQDRALKLNGYDLYRFGGSELTQNNSLIIKDFFLNLFKKYNIV